MRETSPTGRNGRRELLISTGAVVAGAALVRTSSASAEVDDPIYRALASEPALLLVGDLQRNADGVIVSAPVVWPDGTPGEFTGTPSQPFPGATDSYTITYGAPAQRVYTQPKVARDPETGAVSNRPAIEVSTP